MKTAIYRIKNEEFSRIYYKEYSSHGYDFVNNGYRVIVLDIIYKHVEYYLIRRGELTEHNLKGPSIIYYSYDTMEPSNERNDLCFSIDDVDLSFQKEDKLILLNQILENRK